MTLDEKRFIGEAIDVAFDRPSLIEKRPGCPDCFLWDEELFVIEEKLAEWHDYRRRGRREQNMRPERLPRARLRGSWGVGRDYYRVRVSGGRVFEIYFDRAPKSADVSSSGWTLFAELPAGG